MLYRLVLLQYVCLPHVAENGSTGQGCQSPFAPENLVSRDGFGRLVSLFILHNTQTKFGTYSRYSRDFSRFSWRRPFIQTVMRHRLRGGAGKIVNWVFPGRPQRFRHQRRPVDDCSPGRRGMAQDNGTRGGTFHGEMDRCRESQGCTTACSSMFERP